MEIDRNVKMRILSEVDALPLGKRKTYEGDIPETLPGQMKLTPIPDNETNRLAYAAAQLVEDGLVKGKVSIGRNNCPRSVIVSDLTREGREALKSM